MGKEKDQGNATWKSLHYMCSLLAISAAFEDCGEGSGYDLGERSCLLHDRDLRVHKI